MATPLNEQKLLRINLTNGCVTTQSIPADYLRMYLGGKTLGFYLALKEQLVDAAPLSPQNKIYFLTGPLTDFASGGGTTMVTKSPLNHMLIDSVALSHLGYSLKCAGFYGLVIEGSAQNPVYLKITDKEQQIFDAGAAWGMTCGKTNENLRETHADIENCSVVTIGPAGENLVRFASIMTDSRSFGRGGAGAVMGSKKLKAIIIGGSKPSKPYKTEIIDGLHVKLKKYLASKDHPYLNYMNIGTVSVYRDHLKTGSMSFANFSDMVSGSTQSIKNVYNEITHNYQKRSTEHLECFRCYLRCSKRGAIKKGPFAGTDYNSPEFESVWAFGPQCDNYDAGVIIEADYLCDELGLDCISTGNIIGFLRECVTRKLINNQDSIVDLIYKIAYRQDIGNHLANGVKHFSQYVGRSSSQFAMHVKGLELPAFDPRGYVGIPLAYAINKRGGDHRKAFCPEEVQHNAVRDTTENKANMVIREENKCAYRDSLVVCKWAAARLELSTPFYSDFLYGAMGLEMSHNDLLCIGSRAVTMAQLFNQAQGYSSKDDTLPDRLFNEARTMGKLKGKVVDKKKFEEVKISYYRQRKWTDDGKPTADSLIELNLTEFV